MKVESFEKEALALLCGELLSGSMLERVISSPDKISCEFTGVGYFLELGHHELPQDRTVCNTPIVLGKYQAREVGFIAFIQDSRITLECYENDGGGIPKEIRNGSIQVYAI